MRIIPLFISSLVLLCPLPAHAYVGPGVGLSALGLILGILTSIFLAILGLFWYPIKRFIRKFRKAKPQEND
jgi:hypothetical protein